MDKLLLKLLAKNNKAKKRVPRVVRARYQVVNCNYYIQNQEAMRESDKMDLVGLKAWRLFMEIMNYIYSNKDAFVIDLGFRKLLQKGLDYTKMEMVNKHLSTLYKYKFISHLNKESNRTNQDNLFLINPLVSYKGNYDEKFHGQVIDFYRLTEEMEDEYNVLLANYLKSIEDKDVAA